MIAFLRGEVEEVASDHVIIDVSGVGYLVTVPASVATQLKPGQNVKLYTHLQHKEDSLSLYGFLSPQELKTFELLLNVNGVGPKLALALLGSAEPARINQWVATGNVAALTGISGIGRKTAERIVFDLRGKIPVWPEVFPMTGDRRSEAMEALLALGYSRSEVAAALENINLASDESMSLEEAVKQGLKWLASRK